ncbi:hypothetical protein K470DRAFT_257361 [Piedraia hortae CBS 480.64]|uniref:PB1 domain-containing protein n=1 Tax=Piedraia hortae CBS 480.64 TaxID=1314780 RepID=A0A6A7C1A8_9PEZI|nr:hypothetical protein K470DRAFT_257361 [Piedraia hortae CBS 480.64]
MPAPPEEPPLYIRIKVSWDGVTRYVLIMRGTDFREVKKLIRERFNKPRRTPCLMKIQDPDGDKITVSDDSDWLLAVDWFQQIIAENFGQLKVWVNSR